MIEWIEHISSRNGFTPYLDGGIDTYLTTDGNDTITLHTDSEDVGIFRVPSSGNFYFETQAIRLHNGGRISLDGTAPSSSSNYIRYNTSDKISLFVGGEEAGLFRLTGPGSFYFQSQNMSLHNNGKVILDGQTPAASTNYITYDNAASEMKFFVGSNISPRVKLGNNGQVFMPGVYNQPSVGSGEVTVKILSTGELRKEGSSIRFKENITALDVESEKIFELVPHSFTFKDSNPTDNDIETGNAKDFGYIAEEVDEVFPEMVIYDDEGLPFSVRYDRLAVLLLVEVKKLKEENDELRKMIENLHEN